MSGYKGMYETKAPTHQSADDDSINQHDKMLGCYRKSHDDP